MLHKKITEPVLLDVAVRPENGEKVILFHFSDQTFHSINLQKGMSKDEVAYKLTIVGGEIG